MFIISPYIILIDNTETHFTASRFVFGLLIKPQPSSLHLSRNAQKVWFKYSDWFAKYDPTMGISENGFKVLESYVQQNHCNIQSIILDWDKTITKHATFRSSFIDKYVTECYFGGFRRMKCIKKFLKTCRKKKVNIIVLTCNMRARTLEGKRMIQRALSFVCDYDIEILFTDKLKVGYINTHMRN